MSVATDPALAERLTRLARTMAPYEPAMLKALCALCRIPSVKGPASDDAPFGPETARALACFLEQARELGFAGVNLGNQAGYAEWGQGSPLVGVLCHLDVVPPGDSWPGDPFDPQVTADRVISRGTVDDKGPAIAVLFAMKSLLDEGFAPRGRIRLIVGLDEESGSSCMEHYAQVAERPVCGFTPDADFPVIYAEKGNLWLTVDFPGGQAASDALRLTAAQAGKVPNMVPGRCDLTFAAASGTRETAVIGQSAHASLPWHGENAISLAMVSAAEALRAAGCRHPFVDFYLETIGSSWRGEGFGIAAADESGPLTLNAGMLDLSDERARLTLDIRYPVSLDSASILSAIKRRIEPHGAVLSVLRGSPPLCEPKSSPLVQTLLDVYNSLTGSDASPLAIGGGTYARSMSGILAYGPNFPGETEMAHQAGEYISRTSFLAMAAIYREALRRLAG
jgi:succinyl-diaminopimelate desuccinylase